MIPTETNLIEKDCLFTTLPDLYKEFEVRLKLKAFSFPAVWSNAIRLTVGGGDLGPHGTRIPAIFLKNNQNLYISFKISGNDNRNINFPIQLNTLIELKISQKKLPSQDGSYEYEISNNGTVVFNTVNELPEHFNEVKVYASDSFYDPLDGVIQDLEVCTEAIAEEGMFN